MATEKKKFVHDNEAIVQHAACDDHGLVDDVLADHKADLDGYKVDFAGDD